MIIDEIFANKIEESQLLCQSPIITTPFEIIQKKHEPIQIDADLYKDCIIIRYKRNFFKISFDRQLIFQTILQNQQNAQKNAGNNIFSIRFFKRQKKLQLRNGKRQDHLNAWKKNLAVKLNQGGFHDAFRAIKQIGRGAFASVYLAESNEDHKPYAIKAFPKQCLLTEQNGMKGFINEITAMRAFNHKNLMQIQGVYQSKNSLYICLQLLAGGQLQDKIANKYKFSSQEIRSIMRDILEGLEEMHSKNYMHRDIKPQNILLRQGTNECVIADFGFAESTECSQHIFPRCGTPGFMAPQIISTKLYKAQHTTLSDLFSVGIIFHILILGKSPFPGKTSEDIFEQNQRCKLNFQLFEYNQLPRTWLNLLKGLLEKNPKKRLSASEALGHDFFTKQSAITVNIEITPKDRRFGTPVKFSQSPILQKKVSIECNSPLFQSSETRGKVLLKQSNSLKMKLGQNPSSGQGVSQNTSAIFFQKRQRNLRESKFKDISSQQNS